MKTYRELVEECRATVKEIMPWDLIELLNSNPPPMVLDVREADEFAKLHIPGSINVPRGILEGACDYGYDDTIPELVMARDSLVVVICRSGNRSLLAARTMQLMGYQQLASLNTGVRGWNDYEQELQDANGNTVNIDDADDMLESRVRPEQMAPKSH